MCADGDGRVAIGALTRQHALERSEVVRARSPILAEACRLIGHLPIRHRGTVGGSLAHADPASELPAVMVALEAEMTLAREQARRTVAADQFFAGRSPPPSRPDELLAEIRVPGLPPRTGGAFVEIARRAGDFALVGVAALVTLDASGRCSARGIALCGAGPRPSARAPPSDALARRAPGRARRSTRRPSRAAAATIPPSDVHALGGLPQEARASRHARGASRLAAQRAGGA